MADAGQLKASVQDASSAKWRLVRRGLTAPGLVETRAALIDTASVNGELLSLTSHLLGAGTGVGAVLDATGLFCAAAAGLVSAAGTASASPAAHA